MNTNIEELRNSLYNDIYSVQCQIALKDFKAVLLNKLPFLIDFLSNFIEQLKHSLEHFKDKPDADSNHLELLENELRHSIKLRNLFNALLTADKEFEAIEQNSEPQKRNFKIR